MTLKVDYTNVWQSDSLFQNGQCNSTLYVFERESSFIHIHFIIFVYMYVSSHPVMTPPASAGSPSSWDSTESGLSPIEGMSL